MLTDQLMLTDQSTMCLTIWLEAPRSRIGPNGTGHVPEPSQLRWSVLDFRGAHYHESA